MCSRTEPNRLRGSSGGATARSPCVVAIPDIRVRSLGPPTRCLPRYDRLHWSIAACQGAIEFLFGSLVSPTCRCGLYGGVVGFAVPQLVGDRHLSDDAIAGLTAVAFSPGFWAISLQPILDVRFGRRWYAVVLAVNSRLVAYQAEVGAGKSFSLRSLSNRGPFLSGSI
jgi:hypothetical protein